MSARVPLDSMDVNAPTLPKSVLAKLQAREEARAAAAEAKRAEKGSEAENAPPVPVAPAKPTVGSGAKRNDLSKKSSQVKSAAAPAPPTAEERSPLMAASASEVPHAPKPRLRSDMKCKSGSATGKKVVEVSIEQPADFLEQQTAGFTKWLNHMLDPSSADTEAVTALGTDDTVAKRRAVAAAMAESATRRRAFTLLYRSGLEDVVRTLNGVSAAMCDHVNTCIGGESVPLATVFKRVVMTITMTMV